MKTIQTTVEICDCGCQYCEYSEYNTQLCVDCPYCDGCESRNLETEDGGKQKIKCSYCNKSFWCNVLFDNL